MPALACHQQIGPEACTLHGSPAGSGCERAAGAQVSVAWCIYNSSGPLLLLWHRFFHNRLLTLWVNFWAVASSLIVLAIVILIWIILPPEFDYQEVCLRQGFAPGRCLERLHTCMSSCAATLPIGLLRVGRAVAVRQSSTSLPAEPAHVDGTIAHSKPPDMRSSCMHP